MKKQIKKINITSLAIVNGTLVFGVMLLIGIVINVAVFVLNQIMFGQFDFVALMAGMLGSLLTAVLLGALSFVLGAFSAWLYNFVAGFTGGLILELEDHRGKDESLFEKIEKAIE